MEVRCVAAYPLPLSCLFSLTSKGRKGKVQEIGLHNSVNNQQFAGKGKAVSKGISIKRPMNTMSRSLVVAEPGRVSPRRLAQPTEGPTSLAYLGRHILDDDVLNVNSVLTGKE